MRVAVKEADALECQADVLVLKYASALYGVDRKVAQLLHLESRDLPPPGSCRLVASSGRIAAPRVLFVGMEPLSRLGYVDFEEFVGRALSFLKDEAPLVRSVAMTFHGAGFGLDAMEVFDRQLGGLLAAAQSGRLPRNLRDVTFCELDARKARRMHSRLSEVQAELLAAIQRGLDGHGRRSTSGSQGTGQSPDKPFVFVAMPYREGQLEDVWELAIYPSVHKLHHVCERMDMEVFTGEIMERVRRRISESRLVIADLTGASPNVYLEVGYAWGCGKDTLLIAAKGERLSFDVQGHRCLYYSRVGELLKLLTAHLPPLLGVCPESEQDSGASG